MSHQPCSDRMARKIRSLPLSRVRVCLQLCDRGGHDAMEIPPVRLYIGPIAISVIGEGWRARARPPALVCPRSGFGTCAILTRDAFAALARSRSGGDRPGGRR